MRIAHPSFKRPNYGFKKRVKANWRKPRGIDSKQRMKRIAYGHVPLIGYKGPRATRHVHPCGLREALVANEKELMQINPKTHAARIRGTVGKKKREQLRAKAVLLGIKVLN